LDADEVSATILKTFQQSRKPCFTANQIIVLDPFKCSEWLDFTGALIDWSYVERCEKIKAGNADDVW
jgi:hypothetical protein